ncbi:unnamed protein product [Amoebophrya sp. A25]|nr:unnamed protein product [Amoebophrya sp. A25]|eukprot:GSA25T00023765001.1
MDGGKRCYMVYAPEATRKQTNYRDAVSTLIDNNKFDPRISETQSQPERTVADWHFDNSPNFRGFHRLRSLHLWSSYTNVQRVAEQLTAKSIPKGMQKIFPEGRQVQTENVHISSHKVWEDKMAYAGLDKSSRQQLPEKFHMTIGEVLPPKSGTRSAFLQPSGGAFSQSRGGLVSADHGEDEQHDRDSAEDVDDERKSTIFSTTSTVYFSATSTTSEDAAAPVRPPNNNNATSSSSTTTRRNTPTTSSSATSSTTSSATSSTARASPSTAKNFNYIEFEKTKKMPALDKNVAAQRARMYKKRGYGSVESQDVGAADQLMNIEEGHDVGDEVDESESSSIVHLYKIKNSSRFSRLESTAQDQQRSRVYHGDVDDTGSAAASKNSGGDGGGHQSRR